MCLTMGYPIRKPWIPKPGRPGRGTSTAPRCTHPPPAADIAGLHSVGAPKPPTSAGGQLRSTGKKLEKFTGKRGKIQGKSSKNMGKKWKITFKVEKSADSGWLSGMGISIF